MFAGYPDGPRRLGDCCKALDIKLLSAHNAFNDAMMTSELLHHLLNRVAVHIFPDPISIEANPSSERHAFPRDQASNPRKLESTYLSGLVHRLSANGDAGLTSAVSVAQYLNLLEQVLEDRKLDSDEADILYSFAASEGLSQDRVAGLHAAFVANLCAIAASDGEVTALERRDIEQVAKLLAINDWETLLIPSGSTVQPRLVHNSGLAPGVSVCFTGEMSVPRAELESRSVDIGMVVKGGVSKKLDLLVVADTDSMSTKAQKARELRIRIVSESVFLRMLSNAEI
jgi:DNA polymerase-3 subunit epsilon